MKGKINTREISNFEGPGWSSNALVLVDDVQRIREAENSVKMAFCFGSSTAPFCPGDLAVFRALSGCPKNVFSFFQL